MADKKPGKLRCGALGAIFCLLFALSAACPAGENFFGVGEDAEVVTSPALEKSIRRGLSYLASKQNPDGSWTSQYGKNVGENALALMAFMSMGNFPGEGEYGPVLAKGLDWMMAQSQTNGLIQYTGQTQQAPVMYGHALATLMLSEIWGQTRRKEVREVLSRAVDLIVKVQGPRGGWNYRSIPQDGDTSVCVMQILALKSAQEAGIFVPADTITKALQLIRTRYDAKGVGYGYNDNHFTLDMPGSSSAGATIMLITGDKDETYTFKPVQHHIDMISKVGGGHKEYFYYYTAVSSYAAGEEYFRKCMQSLEPALLKSQKTDGSWGSVWQTGFAILAAAMPYRYLPVYQR